MAREHQTEARQGNPSPQTPSRPWVAHYPAALEWDAALPSGPVHALMDRTAAAHGGRPAFDFLGKKWTWGQIADLSRRMARGLQDMGVRKGTRVGLFLPNCPYFLISYYAVLYAGGTVVNLNPLYAERELAHHIDDSETAVVVTADLAPLMKKADAMLDGTGLGRLVVCPFADALPFPKNVLFRARDIAASRHPERCRRFQDLIAVGGAPEPVDIDPDNDAAVLQYTGGTTGIPKAAILTHANITANVEQCVNWFHKARPGEEKMLGVLPFFHVFAMTAVMNMSVRCGFEIIALPRFDIDEALKTISKKKPHYFPAVPAIYNAVNHHPRRKKFDLTSLRYCISGGAPLPAGIKKDFEANTGCVVVEGYGLSESSPVVCINPIEGENRAGSIGLPVQNTVVEIVDPASGAPVPPGERGELCVRGPQVMKGYWRKPEETAQTLRDGRLHTGDIAIMDGDGYVYIVDRLKDMIITNGYNVYPRNVEEAVYLHPAVEECVVAGVPDEERGEAVKAWIRLRAGRTLDERGLKEFLTDKISKIEIPRHVEFRDTPLPKTLVGKLSRRDLLEQEKERGKTPRT